MNNKIISGALFDFMGWLTTRPKRIMLSSVDDASPAADAIKEFAKMRGLSLDDARVQDWREALAEQPAHQEPVVFYRCNGCGHAYEQVHPTSCDCMEGSSFEKVNYYTSPPTLSLAQRQARSADTWVGLTDEERNDLLGNYITAEGRARAIEAKLKEKNT